MTFDASNICDNPSIICRSCLQYVSVKNPAMPVNGDDTCLKCLNEAVKLLEARVKEKETADDVLRSAKRKGE